MNYFFFSLFLTIFFMRSNENIQINKSDLILNRGGHIQNEKKENNNFNKRKLKTSKKCIEDTYIEQSYVDLKIHIDTLNLDNQLSSKNLNNIKEPIIKAMEYSINFFESFLEINVGMESHFSNEELIEKYGIQNWDKTLVDEVIDGNNGMFAKGISFVGWIKLDEENIMGEELILAEPIIFDTCGQPEVGLITLNPNINYNSLSDNYLKSIMLHKFTHLLAFHKAILAYIDDDGDPFYDRILKQDPNDQHFYLDSQDSPHVIDYAKKYFGYDEITTISLEMDSKGNVHWPSRILLGEYMSELLYNEEQSISGFTIALLEDVGYFKLKNTFKYTGGLMRFGKNKGCNFYFQKCIGYKDNDGEEVKFENEFYYPTDDHINENYEQPSCSSGRQSKTIYKLKKYSQGKIPLEYQYFEDSTLGGLESANFCPVSQTNSVEIYSGHCSNTNNIPNKERGESFSSKSFCALSSLIKNTASNYEQKSKEVNSYCFDMFCSELSLTIKVGDNYFVCPRGGGKINGVNFEGYLLCPDYNLICTAKEEDLFNNMLNCLDSQIEEKESSYTYNYEIKTTQDSSIYKDQDFVTNYDGELTENGICEKNCMQCKENKICLKCKIDYGLLGSKSSQEIKCELLEKLKSSYYLKDNVYYPCIENCKECENGNSCNTCDMNFKLNDDKTECISKVENCEEYNAEETCKKCKENYVLLKGKENQISCIKESDLGSQYFSITESGIIYYIKCSDSISNCFSCNSATVCTNCDNNFGLYDNNCVDLSSKKYYYDTNDLKYKLCSSKLEGCETCTKNSNSELYCIKCSSTYAFVYGNPDKCILESNVINDDSLFKDSEGNYYSCSDSKYHSVEKCLNCKNKDYCELCQNDYSLFNSKKLCLSDSDINEKKYYLDPIDNNYYLCSKKIQGCNKCENANICIECNSDYGLDENNKCVLLSIAISKYYLDLSTGKYISCNKIENCEECSSTTQCNKCQNGYRLNNNICEIIIENGGDYKALAIGAIILSCIAILGIIAILLILLKKGILMIKPNRTNNSKIETKINNDDILANPEEIAVKSSKRSIHNTIKENNE